jgi:CubicO group peptidase (beta-lactamase class C family)
MTSNPQAQMEIGNLAAAIGTVVDAGALVGAAALVWRDGRVVQTAAVGWRNMEEGLPIEQDTLFRIASMTKPITSTVALMLVEDGKFALKDPIAQWVPEFAEMRVLRSPNGRLDESAPAERLITFEDLLTHQSGLTYGDFHTGPIAKAYSEALGGDIDTKVAPDDWIKGLAALPLIDQPGAAFHYGRSTDLLGLLIARIENATLGEVFERRIFNPLGMKDTGFTVPGAKRHRRAGAYGFDDAGRLTALAAVPGGVAMQERPDDMPYMSGGQGLWSTLDDYLAFARFFVGGGAVDGVRLLRPETLQLMTSNRLTEVQRAKSELLGMPIFARHYGFGMGVAVVLEPDNAPSTPCGGGKGAVGWPGAYGGWWRADPNDSSVLIFLTHNMVRLDQLEKGIGLGVYGAVEQFQEHASVR